MKLRGGAYELPELATKVSRCSPTCALVGVHVTLACPPARPKETPLGSPRLLILPLALSSKLTGSPALTAYAVPSWGVGACQRRLSDGPRGVPAPAPPTAGRGGARVGGVGMVFFVFLFFCGRGKKEGGGDNGAPPPPGRTSCSR